ncbi:2-amino-4-hydroxy-6-hydroxymethyldihydropteridine diphosphokinase [Spongiactinospora gelatinilytica]|uniref:2-amino-4-hydroxy-6-hydroxymethyldihydropteridine diphosphokinase n=1 Tax=Spongiactinospora gelatinilytica TaxID=2666298 RepID=A0A2W2H7E0_9ACTN|nr:2-amino-4-hydroxy-6-hydroxymethyldihydropteridine diphosphokinase [Spongiactinospora gelatinilytica]
MTTRRSRGDLDRHDHADRAAGQRVPRRPRGRTAARAGVRGGRHAVPGHRPGGGRRRPGRDRRLRRAGRAAHQGRGGRAGGADRDAGAAPGRRVPGDLAAGGGGPGERAQTGRPGAGAVRRRGRHHHQGAVVKVVFSLGSNLGRRFDTLQGGLDALFDAPGLTFVAVSPVYETDPVGGPDQGPYLNAVVVAETTLPPRAVLERAQSVEDSFGRRRTERWGPRTLDIDLIVAGDHMSDDPELTLPHPRAHERAFVLVPWAAADPAGELPGHGPVAALAGAVTDQGVRRRTDHTLQVPM